MRLSLWFLMSVVLPLAAQAPVKNPRATAADVEAGGKIFRSHCADCHGVRGEGGKGPDLTTGVYFHGGSDAALFKNITDGIPGTAMPSQFFSADQIWQVVAFVRTLERTGSRSAPPGNAQKGAALFRAKGCVGCHLARGEGGINGPDLSFIGSQRPVENIRKSIVEPEAYVAREYWPAEVVLESGATHKGIVMNEDTYYVQMLTPEQGLVTLPRKDFRKFEVRKSSSAMPSYAGKLSAAELDDLVAFLWTMKRRAGSKP